MPGMVEGHAHLTGPSSIERVVNTMALPIEEHILTTAVIARITLDAGFTSAYSAGALGERMEVALCEQIDGGHLPGPRLRASALEKRMEGVLMGAVSGLEAMEKICPEMKRRGIRVVPGGDYGFPYTPVEAVVAATKTGGEMVAFDVGTIEAGRLADLLLVDGDPTTDVPIMQDRERIVAVVPDGSFHRVSPWHTSGAVER